MRAHVVLCLLLAVILSSVRFSRAQSDAFSDPANAGASLGEIARETRQHHLEMSAKGGQSRKVLEIVEELQTSTEDEYVDKIGTLLAKSDFQGLEDAADRARSSRSRFPGGAWRLFIFYDTIGRPAQGHAASDLDWQQHIDKLKQWTIVSPHSVTAHIALAQAYLSYGWKARGSGFATTVSEEGWQQFGGRADLAASELKLAAQSHEKCPYWYLAMMQLALAQGWSKSTTTTLVEQSISFEPGFYHVYREFAVYLEPKWYGRPGEAEAFAEWISRKLGGEEGKFVYFEIASVLNCNCRESSQMANLSWTKIQEGYSALEHLYGTSKLKMNRFAFMSYLAGDRAAAQPIFREIGDSWDQETWRSKRKFDTARDWAVQ